METRLNLSDRWGARYRRAFDIIVAASLAVLTLPIVFLAVVASVLALRAWPFFCHERVGEDGEHFRFLKVRTLPRGVPAYVDKHHLDNSEIPVLCRFLRRRHLDELPQLYLVLVGKMSLVGPRPEMPNLHQRMTPGFRRLRTSVRPGCTGLWQLSEASTELIDVVPEYDCFYIEHRSLRLDLWIALRTVRNMAGIGGCITLDDIPHWARRSIAEGAHPRSEMTVQSDTAVAEPSARLRATASG